MSPPGTFVSGPQATRDAALFTDLYELTMAASYLREGMNGRATFSLFVRKLPKGRAVLAAAGMKAARCAFLADAPYLDMAYKLVGYEGRHVLKTSAGKATWTGQKQVYRFLGRDGRISSDLFALCF